LTKSKKYKKSDAENNYESVNKPPKIETASATAATAASAAIAVTA